jgi:PAS domain S-box-containing protein
VLDNLLEGCQVISPDFRYLYVNATAASQARVPAEGLVGRRMVEVFPGMEETEMFSVLRRCMEERTPAQMENEFRFPDGSRGWFELRLEPVPDGVAILSVDVTARKHAQDQARRTTRALTTLSACNQLLVRAQDEQRFLEEVCRVVVERGGYRMAWVGMKEEGASHAVRPVARAGHDQGYVSSARVTWDDSEWGAGPMGRAVRTGEPAAARHIAGDPAFAPWREEALARGFGSCMAWPLKDGPHVLGALAIYAAEPDAFDQDERALLAEMALDLAHGLTTLRARAARRHMEARLEHLNAVLRGIRNVNQLITRERDPQALIQQACDLVVESRGFHTACIALCQDGRVTAWATAGVEEKGQALRRMLAEGVLPECVTTALGQGDPVLREDPAVVCVGCPVNRDFTANRDTVALRLHCEGRTFGVLLVSTTGLARDAEEMDLLQEVAGDVAFALHGMEVQAQRDAAQAARAEADQRYRCLFNNMTEGVAAHALVLGEDGKAKDYRILDVNGAYAGLTGIASHKARGALASDLYGTGTAPFLDRYAGVALTGEATCFETFFPPMAKHFNISVFSPGSGLFATVFQDITDRKRAQEDLASSEARYRNLVDNLGDVVFSTDTQGRVQYMSPAVQRLFGHPPQDVVGQHFSVFVHPEDVPGLAESLQKTLGGTAEPHEFRGLDKDGGIRHLRATSRVRWEAGRPVGVDGVLVDLTERRKTEEQLRASQRLESVGRLAGGVAHDFNNLLTVINTNATFALEGLPESHPVYQDVVEIRDAGKRAAALTRQLLAFSRKQVLAPVVLNVNTVVTGIMGMLRRLLGEDITITTHLAADLGSALVDAGQLEQVIMNLAVNARDAMAGGGRLTVETCNADVDECFAEQHAAVTPGRFVMLSVTDTGCGMDAATQEHIFEPFFTTKDKGKGTGLGLATVYGIIKQSGGHIWVYSKPGQGTAFKLYLPRVDAAAQAMAPVTRPVVSTGNETVLVVEDEDAVRRLVERILVAAGYRVHSASMVADALRLFAEHGANVDLLLTDVVMPQVSGRVLADRLAGQRPALKVLFMSGYTDDAIAHHGVLDPGTRLLGKPFSAAELTRKVRETLDGDQGPC